MLPFEDASEAVRDEYRLRARAMIYPDMRTAYEHDRQMVSTLARTLYDLDQLAAKGGGLVTHVAPYRAGQPAPTPSETIAVRCGLAIEEIAA
jgi:hypothetical protein